MKYAQLIIFYLNTLGAMGFSLIAPLFPPLCKDKGISNQICSFIISSICISQIYGSVYSAYYIQKIGMRKLLLISLVGQTACTFLYGFMEYIQNNWLFILSGFTYRLFHGFFSSCVCVIAFSITTTINEGKELERAMGYMELSWGIGLAIGPAVIGIFYDIGGYCLPFILIGLVYISGIYLFYSIPERDLEENKSRKDSTNSLESDKKKENFSFFSSFLYTQNLLLVGSLMVELNTTDFFIPTLVNYLNDSFSIKTSRASLFFLASTFGYIICTQMINLLTDLCNNFKLIFIGHLIASVCCLLTAPVGFLPQSYIFIVIGIFIQGYVGGIINIPAFIELNNFGKKIFPKNKQLQRDIPSSLINFGFFFGDLFSPVLGSFITSHFNFHISAYFAAICSLSMAFIFRYHYLNEIKGIKLIEENQLLESKECSINRENNEKI